jgi:uncharacterized protein DUF433
MTRSTRIEINPKVMLGKPVIRGTRIIVKLILRKLDEGVSQPFTRCLPRADTEESYESRQIPNWQPISALPLIGSLIEGMLQDAEEHYQTLQEVRL